jgi:hypothetical protein
MSGGLQRIRNILMLISLTFIGYLLQTLLIWLLFIGRDFMYDLQSFPVIGQIPYIGTVLTYIYFAISFFMLGFTNYIVISSSHPHLWALALGLALSATNFLFGVFDITPLIIVVAGSLIAGYYSTNKR